MTLLIIGKVSNRHVHRPGPKQARLRVKFEWVKRAGLKAGMEHEWVNRSGTKINRPGQARKLLLAVNIGKQITIH